MFGAETALGAETSGEEREAGVNRGGGKTGRTPLSDDTTGAEGGAHRGVEKELPS